MGLFNKKKKIMPVSDYIPTVEYYPLMRYCEGCKDYYRDEYKKLVIIGLKKVGEQYIMVATYKCPCCGAREQEKEYAISKERYEKILKEHQNDKKREA